MIEAALKAEIAGLRSFSFRAICLIWGLPGSCVGQMGI